MNNLGQFEKLYSFFGEIIHEVVNDAQEEEVDGLDQKIFFLIMYARGRSIQVDGVKMFKRKQVKN